MRAGGIPARVMLRPVGNPLPLGFLGLTVAALLSSTLDLGWIPSHEQHQVAIAVLAFAVPIQLLATVFGLLARDAVVASGIGVQTGGWFAVGLLLLVIRQGSTSITLGVLAFGAAAALLPAVSVASTSKLVPALVMAGTCARFALFGAYQVTGSTDLQRAAGIEGIGLVVLALYAALALDLESSRGRTILPTLRFGSGRQALTESSAEELAGLEHEPGVREEL